MARARASQRAAISYTTGGRTFKRGAAQIITSASEIARLKATSGFSVTMLPDQPSKQKAVEVLSKTEPEVEPAEEGETRTVKRGSKRRGKKD